MSNAKIEVTVNLPEGQDVDLTFTYSRTLDDIAHEVITRYPNYTSLVMILVRS